MTLPIQLKLSFTSSQELLLECSHEDEHALAYASLPKEMKDLIIELQSGKAIQSALNLAQQLITQTLFHGAVGDLLQRILGSVRRSKTNSRLLENSGPTAVLLISAPDELHAWPWELATYPETKSPLFLNSVEVIRTLENLPGMQELNGLNLLKNGRVITKASEVFKHT